ncbi:hypothetical protein H2198_008494, partial [Neophaeococcomyces mojaviensis]
MPHIFKKPNKSQASLEKITDTSASVRDPRTQHGQHSQQHEPDTAYPQSQAQLAYAQPQYHPHSQPPPPLPQQQQQQQQQYPPHPPNQQQLDERYYAEHAQPQAGPPAHLLNHSPSNRRSQGPPPNAYQEQQQLQPQRPTISVVSPSVQHESIAEDEQHQPGRTQYGTSQTVRASGSKDEKKSRRSNITSFFRTDRKEGKDSPAENNRISRTGSVLKKTGQQAVPSSPQVSQQGQKNSPQPAQSPQGGRSEPIAAYPRPSQEDLRDEQRQYETYYRGGDNRPESRFDAYPTNQQQQPRRPSVQYEEDAPHFPPPANAHQPHQPQSQPQFYQQPNVSQTIIEPSTTHAKQYFPYTGQPLRDRPSALTEADQSLRPPSQNSLVPPGPPSPLGNPPQLVSRPSTSNNPRYSVQSAQAYQPVQQPANQLPAPNQGQGEAGQEGGDTQHLQVQEDMPSSGRDRDRQQRESRMDEQDQRYAAPQDPRIRMSTTAHEGRSTPPPRGRDDIQNLDPQTLQARYEELQAKYSKVKRYYFDREAQVTQLQNTVANQRLSMSKTSLDDAQYATRFERLNGAIQNLAFNIRKDWRRLPNWLAPACNRDACTTGTREMTAVGRAIISRWLYERIFQQIFHPGIDPTLSLHLKQMERTLRRTPSILTTEEQRDDLFTKVTTWRLTTCEGLADVLNSRQQEAYTEALARILADQLCDYLRTLLNDPAPQGLEGYLLPIVAQTLSISANLPLESRDICIEYYHPGTPFNDTFMKLETGITALTNPGSAPTREEYEEDIGDNDEPMSVASDADQSAIEEQIREATKAATTQPSVSTQNIKLEKPKKSGGLFGSSFTGGFVNKKPPTVPTSGSRGPSTQDLTQSAHSQATKTSQEGAGGEDDHQWTIDAMTRGQKEGKIRFAVFLAVEVRGKSPGSSKNDQQQSGSGQQQSSNGNGSGGEAKPNQTNASAGPGVNTSSGSSSGGAGNGG